MAAGDILSVNLKSTNSSGSVGVPVAEIEIEGFKDGGTYSLGDSDAGTAKVTIVAWSLGFDANGAATVRQRTLYGIHPVRLAYPNNATNDETESGGNVIVRVQLSEPVYAKDTQAHTLVSDPIAFFGAGFYTDNGAGGSGEPSNANVDPGVECTNESTLAYPKAFARWAWPGWERVTGPYLLECVAYQYHAQERGGVACVKYTVSDEHAHSAAYTVSSMSPTKPEGEITPYDRGYYDALNSCVYRAILNPSAFDDGDLLTVRLQVYPFIGDSDSVFDTSGVTVPSADCHDLKLLCDKAGSWGTVYACVDATAGNDGTAVASETLATAEASPYQTIAAAANGIKARYNTWKSRNSSSGGIIYLREGDHQWIGASRTAEAHGSTYKTWLTVAAHPADNWEACKIVAYSGTGTRTMNVALTKLERVNFAPSGSGGALVVFVGVIASNHVFWAHRCRLNYNGELQACIYFHLNTYLTQNTFPNRIYAFPVAANNMSFPLIRGNTVELGTGYMDSYCTIGNLMTQVYFNDRGSTATTPAHDGGVIAWNYNRKCNTVMLNLFSAASRDCTLGFAVVGNVIEGLTNVSGLVAFQGSGLGNMQHAVFAQNTIPGERCFFSYLDGGTENTTNYLILSRGNVATNWNNKTDTWAGDPNGARVNNWWHHFGTGAGYNCYGLCTSPPTMVGIGSLQSQTLAFADDKSGGGAGNGDYRPAESSVFRSFLPSGLSVFPYDLYGRRLKTTDKVDAGAIQYENLTNPSGGASRRKKWFVLTPSKLSE